MNVTSSTQTQYVANNRKTEESTSAEYKKSTDAVTQKQDEHKWVRELSSDVNTLLKNASTNSSSKFKSTLIKDEIETKISQYASRMMEENGDNPKSELETSKLLNEYKKELLQEYKVSIESSSDTVMTTQQQAVIQVLMQENTQETSVLTELLATKSSVVKETEATGKAAEMEEKYKDVYTPIPERYSQDDEELQTRKIYEAYPDYISGPEFLKIVNSYYDELDGKKIELGQEVTQDQIDKQKIAFDKAYELFGGEEKFTAMIKGVQAIQAKYPFNALAKDGVHNAKEIARFQNATVYEGLEQGKTIEEAKIYAGHLIRDFMDTSYTVVNFIETLIKAGRADEDALDRFLNQDPEEERKKAYDENFNRAHSTSMDLREYGIEGNWEYYAKPENQQDMILEIEKKISQFNFMLHNESKIKEAYLKLDADYQTLGNNEGYKRMINEDYMPRMEAGLNIFKKYKIYD